MKKIKTSGIYSITNINNEKVYYGSSSDITRRFINHKNELKNNKHKNLYLQNAWNKYGEDGFIFKIEEKLSSKQLQEVEQYYLDWCKMFPFKSYNIGYNSICPSRGLTRSPETRMKMSIAKKGSNHPHFRKRLPEKTKIKIGNSLKGRMFSTETLIKMSNACKGKKNHLFGKRLSDETKLKMSKKLKGKTHSIEARLKMSNAQRGEKHSQYDNNVYKFIHPKHGIEESTQYNLRTKYKLNQGNLGQLIKRKFNSVGGWKMYE